MGKIDKERLDQIRRDGAQATAEYKARQAQIDRNTERLRTQRLAREGQAAPKKER
jgi:hypothetical protein